MSLSYTFLVLGEKKMVQRLQQVVAEYEDRLRKMPWVPRFSSPRDALAVVPPIHRHARKQVWCRIILIILGWSRKIFLMT